MCCTPGNAPPIEDAKDGFFPEDGLFNKVMISLFRLAFGRAIGYQAEGPLWQYDGLVDMSRRLYLSGATQEARNERVAELFRDFPARPQLLQDNRLSIEALAQLTAGLFPFLVGPCETGTWIRDESTGEAWQSNVTITRCRFLEESGCKGMCVGLCKRPTEAYFASIGLPLSMTPNFETGSCEMIWGRTPLEEDMATADLSCFAACDVRSAARPAPSASYKPTGDNAYRLTPLQQAKKEAELKAVATIHPEVPIAFREWLYDYIYHELGEDEFQRRIENGYAAERDAPAPRGLPLTMSLRGGQDDGQEAAPAMDAGAVLEELKVDIREAGNRGQGAFAAEAAPAGRWVGTYVGTPVTLLDTAQRYTDTDPEYLFQITPDLYLDAMDSTHFSHYFNHHQNGTLNFTVDVENQRVDFYLAEDVAAGDELTFDYGVAYWAGSGVTPSRETDHRDFTRKMPPRPESLGPKPITPTTDVKDLDATMALPEPEARAGLLRCLEFFGGERLPCLPEAPVRMRIPRGLGPEAGTLEVAVADAPLEDLESAARACVRDAAALEAQRAAEADRASGLAADEVALARRFQDKCPPFAAPGLNALSLAVLLLWSFPDRHGVTQPLTTEEWEALLARVRVCERDEDAESIRVDLEAYAPRGSIDALLAQASHLV